MKKLQFKTSINCSNCIKSVSGFLNEVQDITQWDVDTNDPRKILTVVGEHIISDVVVEKVKEAGFEIEPLSK